MLRRLALILVVIIYTQAFADTGKGLVAKYTFNYGDGRDEVGSNHALISQGVFTADRFGNTRSACFLQGNSDSYINLGSGPELKPGSGTISMWVYFDRKNYKGSGYKVNPIFLTKNLQADDFYEAYSAVYEYDNELISIGSAIDSTYQVSVYSAKNIRTKSWHHIVMSYNDEYIWGCVDGEMLNDGNPARKGYKTLFSLTDSVMIGNTANKKNARFLCGVVDDIYIYNRVLSREEMLELYHMPDHNRYSHYFDWLLGGLCVALIMVVIVWIIQRSSKKELERQKEKIRINARLNELETKAIRTQMNPHFIFNALNTLQQFIIEEDFQNSNNYLTRFSQLLRKLIESSVSDNISLREEMDILTDYLEIEKLRFDRSFEYEIGTNIKEPHFVYIPFMLVQPFVENAIWHGLLLKKDSRRVTVFFSHMDDNRLLCVVDDNGVGRKPKGEGRHPLKNRSLAIDFIRQRLDLLEKATGVACSLAITDKKDEQDQSLGTRVEIIIPRLKHENTHHYH